MPYASDDEYEAEAEVKLQADLAGLADLVAEMARTLCVDTKDFNTFLRWDVSLRSGMLLSGETTDRLGEVGAQLRRFFENTNIMVYSRTDMERLYRWSADEILSSLKCSVLHERPAVILNKLLMRRMSAEDQETPPGQRLRLGLTYLAPLIEAGDVLCRLTQRDPNLVIVGPGLEAYDRRVVMNGEKIDCAAMVADIEGTLSRLAKENATCLV
jgi:hypothetical protein